MMAMLRIVSLGITNHHNAVSADLLVQSDIKRGTGLRTFWTLLSETFNEWMEDKAPRLGAALAYYAAFSISPYAC